MEKITRVARWIALAVPLTCVLQTTAAEELPIAPHLVLPVPADVSNELQDFIRSKPVLSKAEHLQSLPRDEASQQARAEEIEAQNITNAQGLAHLLSVDVEPDTINRVRVYRITPPQIDPLHEKHVFLHLHGGAYLFGRGMAGTPEGMMLAAATQMPVISVDYRMPPQQPFPAAVDDVVRVYQQMLKERPAQSIVMGGTSAGGGLALAVTHKLKQLGLALPGALYAGTPWSDLTKTGDSYYTQEGIDHRLVSYDGFLAHAAKLYAGDRELTDPLLSPVYGDFEDFPPPYLVSGTRDLFLSNTVRVHTKLRAAGREAELMVFEGMSHADYIAAIKTPELQLNLAELNEFLLKHLQSGITP